MLVQPSAQLRGDAQAGRAERVEEMRVMTRKVTDQSSCKS